jgi:hypothetical protein
VPRLWRVKSRLRDWPAKADLRSGTGIAKMPEVVYPPKDDDLKALALTLSRLPWPRPEYGA